LEVVPGDLRRAERGKKQSPMKQSQQRAMIRSARNSGRKKIGGIEKMRLKGINFEINEEVLVES